MSRMTYDETTAWGARQYGDVLDALAKAGFDGEFTQTGGMCAAFSVILDGGYYLLFTDEEDTLSWDRDEHHGWLVALYPPEERSTIDGPLRWLSDRMIGREGRRAGHTEGPGASGRSLPAPTRRSRRSRR